MQRTVGLIAAVVVLASAGFVVLAGVADSDTSITVTQGDFTLTCPAGSFAEAATLTCTLANTSAEAQPWPVVAILHLSSDEDRALVRGSSIDAAFGSRSPAADLDNGVEWIGETLVGYSRFDWPGKAGADPSTTTTTAPAAHTRTVRIVANDDALKEGSERFYIALGPDGSRGVGILYNNRQRVTVTEDDAESSNNELSSLKLTAGRQDHTLSLTDTSHSVTVEYGVTEATLTAEAAHLRASMTMSASHGGNNIDLDGRGGTSPAVLSGEESPAVPLAVGTTVVILTVTAEDGTAGSHRIDIVRQTLGAATTVAVSSDSFTLTCPATADRGSEATCTLANTSSGSAPWPVVAIIHSSADPARALVAEDPIIPDTDPTYSQDVSLGTQQPYRRNFNYGYGELFSGGSRTVYRTYGYEKFDWAGSAAAGASREVVIQLHTGGGRTTEVFYVAVAPSDYTGLSQLVDNKAPVLVAQETPDPSVSGVSVGGVTQTSATVTVTVADPASGGTTLHLRHRPTASTGPWTTTSKTATTTSAEFTLSGLTHSTAYTVQASFDSSFAAGTQSATFTTDNPPPSVSGVSVGGVTQTSATVTVTVADPASGGTTLHLRHRPTASTGPWTTTSKTATTTSAEFTLSGLTHSTAYTVQASFDSSFAAGTQSATFTTAAPAYPLVGFGSAAYSGAEGGTVTVELRLSAASSRDLRFYVRPKQGSVARWDSDYSLGESGRGYLDDVVIEAGETAFSFEIGIVDDDRVEGAETFTLEVLLLSRGVELGADSEAVVTIADNDEPGVVVSPTTVTVDEDAASGTYTVRLASRPSGAVRVVAFSPNTWKVKVTPRLFDISPDYWDHPHTFSVKGLNDYDAADEEVVITHTVEAPAGSGYEGAQAAPVTVKVNDKHTPSVIVERASLEPLVGATTLYRVYLNSDPSPIYTEQANGSYEPTGSHTVTIEATSSNPAVASVSPASATFTADAYDPQVFWVTGESAGTASITHTVTGTDPDYTAQPLVIQSVSVEVAAPPLQQGQETEPHQADAPEPLPAPIPGPVQELELLATADSLTLSWRAPETGQAPRGYIVRINPLGASKGSVKTPKAKKTSVTYSNRQPGTTYKVWVRAQNEAGKGPRTYAVITLPDAPPDPHQPTNQ